MITKRDQDIINLLEDFHIATTNQLHRIFFNKTSLRYTKERLKYLYDIGQIKRTKSTIDNCFAYYTSYKPVQVHHDLIRSEIYSHMINKFNIVEWENERTIDNVRPDAFCFVDDYGIVFPVFVEVHLNNKFNFDKYICLAKNNDLKMAFRYVPRVLICTDRQVTVPKMDLRVRIVDLQMNGLDSLFK